MLFELSLFMTNNCFLQGVAQLTSVCLAVSYPTVVSAPHMLINGFKNLVAVAAETEIEFKEAATFKEYLKVNNPLFKGD